MKETLQFGIFDWVEASPTRRRVVRWIIAESITLGWALIESGVP